MSLYSKRTMITLLPEWESQLDKLKREQFYKETQAEMFRYIIGRGLKAIESERVDGEREERL